MARLAAIAVAALIAAAAATPAQAVRIDPLPPDWHKGANVTAFWWTDLDGPLYRKWTRELYARARARWASFVVAWYQYATDPAREDALNATEIHPSFGSPSACRGQDGTSFLACKTPSLESLSKAIVQAKGIGLNVVVKPLVDVGRNRETAAPRALVNKGTDRRQWFDAYRAMLAQYARIARDTGADMLVVGTGLTGMTDEPEDWLEWRAVVADIRDGHLMGDGGGGYAGALTFGANWDAIPEDALNPDEHRFFWDALDYIGIEGYFPLTDPRDPRRHDDPSVGVLRQGWHRDYGGFGASPVELLRRLHAEYARPVIFTGLGYVSRGGTSAKPSNPDRAQARAGGKVNDEAQLNPYRAAFDVWSGIAAREGWFKGIYWWDWPAAYRVHPGDGGYTPQGKPAEIELCRRHGGTDSRVCRPSTIGARGGK